MADNFIDEYLPPAFWGFPAIASPQWSTRIARSDSGDEQRNQNRMHPMHIYRMPDSIRQHSVLEDLRDHWMVTAGPFRGFPFRDPLDFASVKLPAANLAPPIGALDQVIGTGNGSRTQFQLSKTYQRGAFTYTRPIVLPVVASVVVTVNGVAPVMGWTVARDGGRVTFDSAPESGHVIRAGYLFDVPVRFESDDTFEAAIRTFQTSGYAGITLMETTLC